MKRSKKKNIREIQQKPCGESSPYWNWVYTHGIWKDGEATELPEANPDVLTEDAHLYKDPLSDGQLDKLSIIAVAPLTLKERLVTKLYGLDGLSLEQIALILKLSKNTVWNKLNRARKKILHFYETQK